MKRILLAVFVISLMASCAQTKAWTDKEKAELRTMIQNHKEKSFIRHMESGDLVNLEECVIATISETYPDYNVYAQMPAQTDTVMNVIVSCTSDILGPDYENLTVLFPVAQLQANGVLPPSFTDEQITMFYEGFAGKLKSAYPDPSVFLMAVSEDPAAGDNLVQIMQETVAEVAAPTPAPQKGK